MIKVREDQVKNWTKHLGMNPEVEATGNILIGDESKFYSKK